MFPDMPADRAPEDPAAHDLNSPAEPLAGLERDLSSWDYEAKRLDVLTDTRGVGRGYHLRRVVVAVLQAGPGIRTHPG
jgi:hypothetical protein